MQVALFYNEIVALPSAFSTWRLPHRLDYLQSTNIEFRIPFSYIVAHVDDTSINLDVPTLTDDNLLYN